MSAKKLTRITGKQIGLDSNTLKAVVDCDPNQEFVIARYQGFITSYARNENDNGVYVKFTGDFEAQNLINGQLFEAKNLCLPDLATDHLLDAVRADDDEGQTGTRNKPVKFTTNRTYFAIDVTVKYLESSTTGYTFGYNNLVELEGAKSIFDDLRNKLPKAVNTPKLLKPKK